VAFRRVMGPLVAGEAQETVAGGIELEIGRPFRVPAEGLGKGLAGERGVGWRGSAACGGRAGTRAGTGNEAQPARSTTRSARRVIEVDRPSASWAVRLPGQPHGEDVPQ
jgi:hypothetical protein